MAKMNNIGSFTNSSPNWNKTGTEPPASMKSQGFKAGYKPPAGFFNWFWTKVSKCITELQSKITSIVSFLSTDDFSLYKELDAATSKAKVTEYATTTAYANGNYTLFFAVQGAAATAFDLSANSNAYLTFWGGIPTLYFPRYGLRYIYVNSNWIRSYADVDRSLTYFPRVRRFDTAACNTLADAYSLYNTYKNNYDVVYFETSGLNTQCGAYGRIDCLLGQLTFSGSEATWVVDTANSTFVLNVDNTVYNKNETYAKTEVYNKTEVDSKLRKDRHIHFNKALASADNERASAVAYQDEVGRLYISGSDFIEYADLESTENVEVVDDMIQSLAGGGGNVSLIMTNDPNSTYYIQTYHKYDGSIVRRSKIGSGAWSAWTS